MKIPADVWSYAWSLLADRFEEPTQPVLKLYRRHLEASLEDVEAFERAVYVVLTTERFLPPPQAFVEAARPGSGKRQALDDWRRVTAHLADPERLNEELTPAGRHAVASIGGLAQVGATNISELRHVRREFLDAHRAYQGTPAERAVAALKARDLELLPTGEDHAEP
ncbi:MAG: hypothetical protein ACOC5J_03410 [Gemmatimonadota bacterium]